MVKLPLWVRRARPAAATQTRSKRTPKRSMKRQEKERRMMKDLRAQEQDLIFALDIGTRSVVGVVGRRG